ncbi:MAG: hypothetical protein ACKVUS_21220, partial [Saprospiraceae bacterium]
MKKTYLLSLLVAGLFSPSAFCQKESETDLSKPKTIIWVGVSPVDLFLFDSEISGNSFLQFGAEMGFEDSPFRLGAVLRPIFLEPRNYYDNFKKNGLSGEIGLVLKKFSLGRLTGDVSKAYWGLDLHFGREAYAYSSGQNPTYSSKVKTTWTKVMPRIGFQFYFEMFAIDIALPIGYQRFRHTQSG